MAGAAGEAPAAAPGKEVQEGWKGQDPPGPPSASQRLRAGLQGAPQITDSHGDALGQQPNEP